MSDKIERNVSADEIRKAILEEVRRGKEASDLRNELVDQERVNTHRKEKEPIYPQRRGAKNSFKSVMKYSFRIPILGKIIKTCNAYMKMPSRFNFVLQQVEMLSDRVLVLEGKSKDKAEAVSSVRHQPVALEECSRIIEASGVGAGEDTILDLECGSGEWLIYLRERGYVVKGVETNWDFVQNCIRSNLDVDGSTISEYLYKQEENSFGGVTYFHSLENLPFGTLLEMIGQLRRVIRSGGILISQVTIRRDEEQEHPLVALLEKNGFGRAETIRVSPGLGSNSEAPCLLIGYKI